MKRNPDRLSDSTFDLLVIGGGINGAWAAWDATLRGLSVAVVDRGDFGSETSANSLKIIHGGLRYLQQLDARRMRESIRERSILARVAPDYLRPMPFVVATGTQLHRSRPAYGAALAVTDLIGYDRNRGLDPALMLPEGRTIPVDECPRHLAGVEDGAVTGGAIWYDYQLHNSERLPLDILLSAGERGACIANYVEVREVIVRQGKAIGARVRDVVRGGEFEVRAEVVLNAAGPWARDVVASALPESDRKASRVAGPMAAAVNLVCRRQPLELGMAVRSRATATEDPVCGGGRYLFFVPWRESTLIGTSYSIAPDTETGSSSIVSEDRLAAFVDECNEACPGLDLEWADITFFHHGRLPLRAGRERGRPDALASKPRIIDHQRVDGIGRLVSIEGVKYTTARHVAEHSVDRLFRLLGRTPPPCRTATVPLRHAAGTQTVTGSGSSRTAGGQTAGMLDSMSDPQSSAWTPSSEPEVRAGVDTSIAHSAALHAVSEEMAIKLVDVVLRRTGIGAERCPSREQLDAIAVACAEELGWDAARQRKEIDEVVATYGPFV